jgi:hypothetical protein
VSSGAGVVNTSLQTAVAFAVVRFLALGSLRICRGDGTTPFPATARDNSGGHTQQYDYETMNPCLSTLHSINHSTLLTVLMLITVHYISTSSSQVEVINTNQRTAWWSNSNKGGESARIGTSRAMCACPLSWCTCALLFPRDQTKAKTTEERPRPLLKPTRQAATPPPSLHRRILLLVFR